MTPARSYLTPKTGPGRLARGLFRGPGLVTSQCGGSRQVGGGTITCEGAYLVVPLRLEMAGGGGGGGGLYSKAVGGWVTRFFFLARPLTAWRDKLYTQTQLYDFF